MPLRMPDDQAQRTEPPRATLRLPQNAAAPRSAAASGKSRGYLAFFACVENYQCTPDSREVPWLYPFSLPYASRNSSGQ